MNDKMYLITSILAAIRAGEEILNVYRSPDFKVEEKADKSPLTLADRRSHKIIVTYLKNFEIPILSEEGKDFPYPERKKWDTYWLIDPLDGTKEFIKKNGEFTVNIAMIQGNKPVAGVINVPDRNTLYFASKEIGSFKAETPRIAGLLIGKEKSLDDRIGLTDIDPEQKLEALMAISTSLPLRSSTRRPYTVAGSRSHGTPELEAFVEEKRREHGEVEFISAGSSLKLCLVAEGRADIYPRTGPTMEWDTAAGQAVVECSGGRVLKYDTDDPLDYNKENLLNPWFVACRVK
jgi:3'(2'), 5'-bisphosphate nucleotidase